MKISVIIPTYNRIDFLIETVNSILAQKYAANEIIVVDDGSDDKTEEIIKKNFSNKVNYIKQKNSGQLIARYNGIALAKNDWIALCDSDDIWEPEYLNTFVQFSHEHPEINVYFSNFFIINASGQIVGVSKFDDAPRGWLSNVVQNKHELSDNGSAVCRKDLYLDLLDFQAVFVSALIFNKTLYDVIGGMAKDLGRINSEDSHLTRRLVANGKVGFSLAPNVKIRKHEGNFSQDYLKDLEGQIAILTRLHTRKEIPQQYLKPTRESMNFTKRLLFLQYIWNKEYVKASILYQETPKNIFSIKEHLKYLYSSIKLNVSSLSRKNN